MGPRPGSARIEPLTIIGHAQRHLVLIEGQRDLHPARLSVSGDVGQRLLDDPEQCRLQWRRKSLVTPRQGKDHLQALFFLIASRVLS